MDPHVLLFTCCLSTLHVFGLFTRLAWGEKGKRTNGVDVFPVHFMQQQHMRAPPKNIHTNFKTQYYLFCPLWVLFIDKRGRKEQAKAKPLEAGGPHKPEPILGGSIA